MSSIHNDRISTISNVQNLNLSPIWHAEMSILAKNCVSFWRENSNVVKVRLKKLTFKIFSPLILFTYLFIDRLVKTNSFQTGVAPISFVGSRTFECGFFTAFIRDGWHFFSYQVIEHAQIGNGPQDIQNLSKFNKGKNICGSVLIKAECGRFPTEMGIFYRGTRS